MKKRPPQILLFVVLGFFAAAVNWGVRIPLSLFMPFPAAIAVAYAIGMMVGFSLYRRYVFPGGDRPIAHQAMMFFAVNVSTAILVMAAAIALVAAPPLSPLTLSVREALAHGLAIGLGAALNFFGNKLVTFAKVDRR